MKVMWEFFMLGAVGVLYANILIVVCEQLYEHRSPLLFDLYVLIATAIAYMVFRDLSARSAGAASAATNQTLSEDR